MEAFQNAWQLGALDAVVAKVLANTDFWGEDLTKINGLSEAIVVALTEVEANGIENGYANFSAKY